MDKNPLVIHTDGGSRGNPGPAASAFVVEKDGEIVFEDSLFLGMATNNFAEYKAVTLALEWIIKNVKKEGSEGVEFLLDSELVVKQINGLYKVKDENLKKMFLIIKTNIRESGLEVSFKHVRREQNKEADRLVNVELDKQLK